MKKVNLNKWGNKMDDKELEIKKIEAVKEITIAAINMRRLGKEDLDAVKTYMEGIASKLDEIAKD